MKHKSETFEKFKEFQSEVENQRDRKIMFLRSDHGGEYFSHEFGTHLRKCGIVSQLMPPGTPQRNGVSKHCNRTLLDMVRSMMSLTDLPLSFWGCALETAALTPAGYTLLGHARPRPNDTPEPDRKLNREVSTPD
jgi:transposase InsO family protein